MSEQGCVPDLIVRAEDWPHGLRCGECCRVLRDGDPYRERLTGMMGEFPAYMLVCRPCGEGRHTSRVTDLALLGLHRRVRSVQLHQGGTSNAVV